MILALRPQGFKGFTLVEVLIALAVLAIALPALMLTISGQINGLSHISDKTVAHWVAVNKMTELRLQNQYKDFLPNDRMEGDVSMQQRQWRWQVDTKKTANDELLEVTVMVRLDGSDFGVEAGSESNLASLQTFFPLP